MSAEDGRTPASLNDYFRLLRRRKWAFLGTVFVVPAVAVVLSVSSPPTYGASAMVLLNQQNVAGASQGAFVDPARAAQTQADLARVLEVAQRAVADAGMPGLTPARLLAHSSVVPSPGSDFLTFSVQDSDPKVAERLATTYARSYDAYRFDLDTTAIAHARAIAQHRKEQLKAAGLARSAEYRSIVQQIAALDATQVPTLVVLHGAYGAVKIGPRVKRNAGIALVLGLVLGISLAFLWDVLDTRVRSIEPIRSALQRLPLLGRIPKPPRALRKSHLLVMLTAPTSADAEPFRLLRANFEFAVADIGAKTIMVTSGVGGEGKSTTVANLAVALARSGRKVVLIDFDLRNPGLDGIFDLDGAPGLVDIALFDAPLESALAEVRLTDTSDHEPLTYHPTARQGRLEVLPFGRMLRDPDQVPTDVVAARIIESLHDRADYVLIDAGPLLPTGDTIAMSAYVDAILLVVRLNGLPLGSLDELGRVLASSPAEKLGFVLTGAEATPHRESRRSGATRRVGGMMSGFRSTASDALSAEGQPTNLASAKSDADERTHAAEL